MNWVHERNNGEEAAAIDQADAHQRQKGKNLIKLPRGIQLTSRDVLTLHLKQY